MVAQIHKVTGLTETEIHIGSNKMDVHAHIRYKKLQTPHLVTVKPLPNNMSIRRNTKKLTEKSNFPGDRQRWRETESETEDRGSN